MEEPKVETTSGEETGAAVVEAEKTGEDPSVSAAEPETDDPPADETTQQELEDPEDVEQE